MNNLSLAGAIFMSPVKAFEELRERPRFWFPLLLISAAMVVSVFWYYSVVDIDWLKDRMFSADPRFQQLPPEQREQTMRMMTGGTLKWSSVISILVMIPLGSAAVAGYAMLIGKITNVRLSFKHWFAQAWWCSLPMLVSSVIGIVMLALKGDNLQIDSTELQILSLNDLLQLAPSAKGYVLAAATNLFSVWALGLCIVAVHEWSKRSWLFSSLFVLHPVLVVCAIVAIRAL